MLRTALIADAVALGPHWLYDQASIATQFPNFVELRAPATSYHPGKLAGDQTHLGDQVKLLAESLIATEGEADHAHFLRHWKAFWTNPATLSYRDKATKQVLETNSPTASTELAGVARVAPLAMVLIKQGKRGDTLAEGLYAHVSLTHRSEVSQRATALLADLLTRQLNGASLAEILPPDPLPQLPTGTAILELGQSCDASAALPASLLLLKRHGHDPAEALRQNAWAGGDSAARGLFMAMILSAQADPTLPAPWVQGLRAHALVSIFAKDFPSWC
jgi:ADP-ribosylglycohydrolase